MAVLEHAAPDHGAVEDVEGGEQGGNAVALVIVGHGAAFAGLEREPRLGAVEGLDLALFVHREHHVVGWRVHVQADNVAQLVGEVGIGGALEGSDTVRLELVGGPDALHRTQADANRLGHHPPAPVGGLARRLPARQRHHPPHRLGRQRRLAGRPGLVAQQPRHALLGINAATSATRSAARPRHATCATASRSPERRMIRARTTCLCGRLRSSRTAANRARSSAPTITQTSCAMRTASYTCSQFRIFCMVQCTSVTTQAPPVKRGA